MNARQFFIKVMLMREAQKKYAKTRIASALQQSKLLENEIDAEIDRVQVLLEKHQPKQTNLFEESS